MDLEPTDESRTRGGSRAAEPAFLVKKHTESAYYVDLQPTDETRTRGGSRTTEPAFLGKTTWNLHITWILWRIQKRRREPYEKSAELLGGQRCPSGTIGERVGLAETMGETVGNH